MLPAGFPRSVSALGALVLAACAAPGSDIHLAPFYTRTHTADGGTLVEIAGGLYRQHRRDEDGFLEWRTLAPLYGIERKKNGDYSADHPFLLGRTRHVGQDTVSYTAPLYLSWDNLHADGRRRGVTITLPGFFIQRDTETRWGWFPFYGHFEDVLTFDQATFGLWPFYVSNDRNGRKSTHILWPFFGWTKGAGESSWHVFPLISRATWEGRYDRTYFLWPFFHYQKNHLGGGEEVPETIWWFFPFIGQNRRGTYLSTSVLWPFFGYSSDSRSGFWGLDAPFPLVRIQRGPEDVERTRFWPLFSHHYADGLETRTWLWPLIQSRHEDGLLSERDTKIVIPFWQTWDRLDKTSGTTSAWRKLWPLYRYDRDGDWRSGTLLELDPFFRNDLVPRGYTSFFRLFEWEEEEPIFRRERAFLGLYRRERGRGEDRRSVAGLWARRVYEADGHRVRETSLLFGLLRWRVTADRGFDMLRPAFPGPGWPRPAENSPAPESRTFF